MEFKTSELNGLLLSIAEPPFGSPALSIEVFNGRVSPLIIGSVIELKAIVFAADNVLRSRD